MASQVTEMNEVEAVIESLVSDVDNDFAIQDDDKPLTIAIKIS